MRSDRNPLIAALLVVVLTVALGAIGFGHRGASLPDPAYAAYLAAGGSAGDLCGDGHAPAGHETGAKGCEACRLAAAMALPAPARVPDLWPHPERAGCGATARFLHPARHPHALPQTRAPPRA
jgi:hypothetical protein